MVEGDQWWRTLAVKCNGEVAQWQQLPESDGSGDDYKEVIGPGGVGLDTEHVCLGGDIPLILVIPKEPNLADGAELVCDIPDANEDGDDATFEIKAPNKCVLLCDFHLGMIIESRLNEGGEYEFVDQDGAAIPADQGGTVRCWDYRKFLSGSQEVSVGN